MTDLVKKEAGPPQTAADIEATRLVHGIDRTRADLSATLAALEARLDPSGLREQVGAELQHVEERVRVVVRDQMGEAKTLVQGELLEARRLLRAEMNEAERKVKTGLAEARIAVKKDLKDAVSDAKQSVRAATLGKVEDLATDIGDKMNDTRDTLVDTIRSNPLPAAMVGVGFAWLLMNRSSSASDPLRGRRAERHGLRGEGAVQQASTALHRAGDSVGDAVHHARDVVGDGVHQASQSASSALHDLSDRVGHAATRVSEQATVVAHKASDAASRLAHKAGDAGTQAADGIRQGARRVEQEFQGALRDNPAALGAAALALGAVVGFALPRTDGEDSLMGETRDRVLDRTGEAAHDAAASVARLVGKAPEGRALQADGAPNLTR